jgi:cobaltochelatase CobS
MELSHLIGQFVLANGSTRFVHGPLAVAARDGHMLILNESDLMDPAELAGLNDILEGQALVIAENAGEVIHPHPKFRVFATGNSAGAGDASGLYQGVLRQNLAFMDRFRVIPVGYPDPAIEHQVVKRRAAKLPDLIIDKMLAVAAEIRRLFLGDPGQAGPELTVTMSTRTLVRWATLSLTFKGAPRVFEYALTQALTARAEPEQREAIHRIAADVFGEYWDPASSP